MTNQGMGDFNFNDVFLERKNVQYGSENHIDVPGWVSEFGELHGLIGFKTSKTVGNTTLYRN